MLLALSTGSFLQCSISPVIFSSSYFVENLQTFASYYCIIVNIIKDIVTLRHPFVLGNDRVSPLRGRGVCVKRGGGGDCMDTLYITYSYFLLVFTFWIIQWKFIIICNRYFIWVCMLHVLFMLYICKTLKLNTIGFWRSLKNQQGAESRIFKAVLLLRNRFGEYLIKFYRESYLLLTCETVYC